MLHELTPLASLEEAFMELTSGSLEFGQRDQSAARLGSGEREGSAR